MSFSARLSIIHLYTLITTSQQGDQSTRYFWVFNRFRKDKGFRILLGFRNSLVFDVFLK